MPRIELKYGRPLNESEEGKSYRYNTLSKQDFESFNTSVLGSGNVAQDGKYVQAIAAFFDLEGFTSFSNQVDSHLVIPEFLKLFMDWLFPSISEKFKRKETDSVVTIWGSLPFYAKFLGDGILFLWDTDYSFGMQSYSNIIVHLRRVTLEYQKEFLPHVRQHVSKPPCKLRCGVARGQIISIGDGRDYVGSCINIASRLQKLSQLTFAISRRGLDLFNTTNPYWNDFALKKVELRGLAARN